MAIDTDFARLFLTTLADKIGQPPPPARVEAAPVVAPRDSNACVWNWNVSEWRRHSNAAVYSCRVEATCQNPAHGHLVAYSQPAQFSEVDLKGIRSLKALNAFRTGQVEMARTILKERTKDGCNYVKAQKLLDEQNRLGDAMEGPVEPDALDPMSDEELDSIFREATSIALEGSPFVNIARTAAPWMPRPRAQVQY